MTITIYSILAFMLAISSSFSQTELDDLKSAALDNLTNTGNIFIRSHQVLINKNFDDTEWRKTINRGNGLPILNRDIDIVEELSVSEERYTVSWQQSSKYAKSSADLDEVNFGQKIVNTIDATEYRTPDIVVLKSLKQPLNLNHYWELRKNNSNYLLDLNPTLQTACNLLYGDFLGNNKIFNKYEWAVSEDSTSEEILIDGYFTDNIKYYTKKYMSAAPEKLISIERYNPKGDITWITRVKYLNGNPLKITIYSFHGISISQEWKHNEDYLLENCHSLRETTILEYKTGYESPKFAIDPLASVRDGDVIHDSISGYYEVVGKPDSKIRLSDIPTLSQVKNNE